MKVWLYYRLSRDEDEELNSLTNQRKILANYADENGHEIVGESFDDNVSGMHFNREGIDKIYDAVEKGMMEAVIVKDLSRLGRHRTQTAMFIDFLTQNNVRVLSVTENIDTFNEADDLIIGFKGIMNDFYAKDGSRRVRTGYRQKQKDGLVMIPPLGYFKDKNTNKVVIVEETAEIVRKIFSLYTEGRGLKIIAKMLNEQGIKSAGFYQKKLLNKRMGDNKPDIGFQFLWEPTGVKRILTNEFYIGTVVCHKTETSKINKTHKPVPEQDQYRHENFVPAIVSKEIWGQAQFLLADKPKRNVRVGKNGVPYRYTGLIECGDCGSCFVAVKRQWRDQPHRIEYVCNGYHRYGKEHCTSHRVDEETLDKLIYNELMVMKRYAKQNWLSIESDVKLWISQKGNTQKKLSSLKKQIISLESEIEGILMERITDKENRQLYDSMLEKRKSEVARCHAEIDNIQNTDVTIQNRKAEIKQSIDLIDDIITSGSISDTHLRMLLDKIYIREQAEGLKIDICIKAQFRRHVDFYNESGEITEKCFEMWVQEA